MEPRAKQRLTGAIILVALFVLLVPELLTGPRDGHTAPETTADEGLHRYTIDFDAQNGANNSAAHAPTPPAVALPAVPSAADSTSAVPGNRAAPERPTPATSNAASNPGPVSRPANPEAAPVAAPASQAAAAAVAAPGNPSPAKVTAPARTDNAHAPLVESTPKNPTLASGFAVQLGTFGKRENAERLVRDMTAKGFAAFVVPTNTNGHELFRVRVGPAHDRAAAEALAAQLKRAGQSGSIVPIS